MTTTALVQKLKRIKGSKTIKQMKKAERREYARVRNHLWLVTRDNGTKVFKNKGATLYGVTPKEFAIFKKVQKIVSKKGAR